MMPAHVDFEPRAEKMIPFLFGRSESVSLKGQASESFPKVFNRITGIDQGSDHHVPADAGKTV
jgi:hypothetical protein